MRLTKKHKILICALALLLCLVGVFFAIKLTGKKATGTDVVSFTLDAKQGYQLKLTFDESGDNGMYTLGPLRVYLGKLLGIEDTSGIYFSKRNMKDLEINLDANDYKALPRVITFGTEMDINKGSDGKSSCTLKNEYTVVLYGNQILQENKITNVTAIEKVDANYSIKCTFENNGNYENNQTYLQDNLNYLVVNGKKLSEVTGVQVKYDKDVNELDGGTLSINIPDSIGLIRNDKTDVVSVLAGFVIGDDSALYKTNSYRLEDNGAVAVVGAEILSFEELERENGKRKIVVKFSEYGNNQTDLANVWKNAIKFNGKSLEELDYQCYFVAEKTTPSYSIGKELYILIPKIDFKNDGTDKLVFEENTQINSKNSIADSDCKDTYLIYGFTHEFEEDNSMVVEYTTTIVSDGKYFLKMVFDNDKDFLNDGWEEYRAKTTITGTTVSGKKTSFKATTSYFFEDSYQIPFELSSTAPDWLDLTKPITVTLDAGITARVSDGTYLVLKNKYTTEFVPLQVETISKKCEGENVVFTIEFNSEGKESTLGGYIDWYKSYIQIRGEKKTADGWESVTYNMSEGWQGGIGQDTVIKNGGYAMSWYSEEDGSLYYINIKNIMPKTTLDLSRPVYVKVLAGFEQLDPIHTNENERVASATLLYDSEEYEFELAYETVSVVSHTDKIEKGMGVDTVLMVEFDNVTIEADHGAIVEQYRSKVWLDGKSISDEYWGGKVYAWYNKGVYEIHISNDISPEIFSFYKPHTLQIKAGFFMVDPDEGTISSDGKEYHLQAKYVLMEDTPVWNIKELPEPIEVEEYYTDLNIKEVGKMMETEYNQTLAIKFDRAVSYNFLPHINCPIDWLSAISYKADIPSLPYTKTQIDYIVNNGLNTAIKEKILIDGVSLGEKNDGDSSVFPNSIVASYGAVSSDVLQINFNKQGNNKLDMTVSHTITFLAGFKTPLGGMITEDVTYISDPTTGAWSKVENA